MMLRNRSIFLLILLLLAGCAFPSTKGKVAILIDTNDALRKTNAIFASSARTQRETIDALTVQIDLLNREYAAARADLLIVKTENDDLTKGHAANIDTALTVGVEALQKTNTTLDKLVNFTSGGGGAVTGVGGTIVSVLGYNAFMRRRRERNGSD